MANTGHITDEIILKDSISKLKKLMEEDRVAAIEKEKRDKSIQRARLIIELYSDGKPIEDLLNSAEMPTSLFEGLPTQIRTQMADSEKPKFEYPHGKMWKHKIIAVVKHENRVLSVKEIVDIIQKFEPNYTEKQLTGLVSNTITIKLVKNNILKIHKDGGKGYYYGSPLWWDDNGELKKEFYPIKKMEKIW
jgi:hypothetical protein